MPPPVPSWGRKGHPGAVGVRVHRGRRHREETGRRKRRPPSGGDGGRRAVRLGGEEPAGAGSVTWTGEYKNGPKCPGYAIPYRNRRIALGVSRGRHPVRAAPTDPAGTGPGGGRSRSRRREGELEALGAFPAGRLRVTLEVAVETATTAGRPVKCVAHQRVLWRLARGRIVRSRLRTHVRPVHVRTSPTGTTGGSPTRLIPDDRRGEWRQLTQLPPFTVRKRHQVASGRPVATDSTIRVPCSAPRVTHPAQPSSHCRTPSTCPVR